VYDRNSLQSSKFSTHSFASLSLWEQKIFFIHIKVKLRSAPNLMGRYRTEVEAHHYSLFISELERGACLTLIPGHFTPEKEPRYALNKNLGGPPEAVWMVVEERKISFPHWGSNRKPFNSYRVAMPTALSVRFNRLLPPMLSFS
jgi:hypothetical protein